MNPSSNSDKKQDDSGAGAGSEVKDRTGTIIGEWRLEKKLGGGGFGDVYAAVKLGGYEAGASEERTMQAIKIFEGDDLDPDTVRKLLVKEVENSLKFTHPNIVHVWDWKWDHKPPYILMNYIDGCDLDKILKDKKYARGMPLKAVLRIIGGVAEGLKKMHDHNIIHSDLKPGNIMVTKEGDAVIVDLGISRRITSGAQMTDAPVRPTRIRDELSESSKPTEESKSKYRDDQHLGVSPFYASLEILSRLAPHKKDDVYALACITYELLTGRRPYGEKDAREANRDGDRPKRIRGLRPDRWWALRRGLSLNMQERTPCAIEFAQGLEGRRVTNGVLNALMLVATVVGLGTATLLYYTNQGADPDVVWLEELGKLSQGAPPVTEEAQNKISIWLNQGRAYLGYAQDYFDEDEFMSAHLYLQSNSGADTAKDAFMSVLKRENSEEAKQGMRNIVSLYHNWGKSKLEDGNPILALWMACHGLSVQENSRELNNVANDARARLKGSMNTDCAFMVKQTP